jgi:large subunit ribosomal protein L18
MKKIGKRGLPYKRKREGKTDYRKRLNLLKSKLTRMVIRRSLKEIVIQFVNYSPDGDKILSTTRSTELKKHGLTGSKKNIPAAYLVGLLAGKKAKELKITTVTPDFGIRKPHQKGVVFAALKGVIDAGIKTSLHDSNKNEAIFPDKERLKGNHTKTKINYDQIKEKISK